MFDKELFTKRLIAMKKEKSFGFAARHVRMALEKSGIEFGIYPPSAYMYEGLLEDNGFIKVNVKLSAYTPKLADIIVWNVNQSTRHGYIQAYTEIGWVSDFKQETIYPNEKQKEFWLSGGCSIFRHKNL